MKKQTAAYSGLADWFEYLNDDCGYDEWSQYLISKLGKFPVSAGLDIGCGSGRFTRDFRRSGYEMTGMDISSEMLGKAEALAADENLRIRWLSGDISKYRPPEKYDFATAINDCVNYIPKQKLHSAFKNVYSALNKNGIFLFDISSSRKFREKIANTVCADDRDDVTYLCFNTEESDRMIMDVTLFVKRNDGAFDRLDERHIQYIYGEEEIVGALSDCGFALIEAEGYLGADKSSCDRICFLAQRR